MALHGTMHSPKMTMNLQQISNRCVWRHKHHQQRYHKHHYHHQQHYWQIPSPSPSATDASNLFTMCTSKHYCVNKQSHSSPSIWGTNPPNNTKHLPKMDACKLPQHTAPGCASSGGPLFKGSLFVVMMYLRGYLIILEATQFFNFLRGRIAPAIRNSLWD